MNKDEFAAYMRHRYAENRSKAVILFGGKCVRCGSQEQLEFDHVNREEKTFNIANLWRNSWSRIEIELRKCQLLCWRCHQEKSKPELAKISSDASIDRVRNAKHIVHCIMCGKEIIRMTWRLKQRPRSCCSRKCASLFARRLRSEVVITRAF
jgi:hypothetical protein